MDAVKIRNVSLDDIEQLQKISRRTFSEAFSSNNKEENIAQYLEEGFAAAKLAEEIRNENSEFWFAEIDDEVVGYLKVNLGNAQTELKDEEAIEIERIYVLKEYHGQKVGQSLYEKAIEVARQRNAEYVWLGVWEENPRAIRFYEKNGFVGFDRHIFRLGDEEQTDIMMRLRLK